MVATCLFRPPYVNIYGAAGAGADPLLNFIICLLAGETFFFFKMGYTSFAMTSIELCRFRAKNSLHYFGFVAKVKSNLGFFGSKSYGIYKGSSSEVSDLSSESSDIDNPFLLFWEIKDYDSYAMVYLDFDLKLICEFCS